MGNPIPAVTSVCVFVLLSIRGLNGHPQCMDSRPPFEAGSTLSFCPSYSEFGCCTNNDDLKLFNSYETLQNRIESVEPNLWRKCSDYAKQLLCQSCSPYSAHIFDAEVDNTNQKIIPRTFPGLCSSYCDTFFGECKNIMKYYLQDSTNTFEKHKLLTAVGEISSLSFCKAVNLSDYDYCYPDLLTNKWLNGDISIETRTSEGCLCVEPVGTQHKSLRNPIFLKHADDGSNRMFVGEQLGYIHIYYPDGRKEPDPFLDLKQFVYTTSSRGDERGMLGMAFHPNYKNNGKFYLYYSTKLNEAELRIYPGYNHKIRIEELMVNSTNPNKADDTYYRIILEIYEPYWNHNGGEILFGDDNYMYLFVGDGGQGGDPLYSGQDLNSLLGKVLRIDVDTPSTDSTSYSIPPDNPFADGVLGRPEIYAFGVRNIWRCGKDRGDPVTGYGKGRIVCGDVGQSTIEELDLIEKGANYGWNLKEGTVDFCASCPRALANTTVLTPPIQEYGHTVGKSITGGHFYRGCHNPNLNGYYFYADFVRGGIFRLVEDPVTKTWSNKTIVMCGSDWCKPPLHNLYETKIISFGEDEAGEVYMLSTGYESAMTENGSIYRIVDPWRRGNPADCKSARPAEPTTVSTPVTTPTTPATTTTTTQTTTAAPTTPEITTNPGLGSATVSRAADRGMAGPRQENYLDYFRRHYRVNQRRKIQSKYKEDRKQKDKHRVSHRTPPAQRHPAALTFHGITVKTCTHHPIFWCSLNRLILPPNN